MTHAGARCAICDEQHALLALFGEENFYLELQNHRMTDEARVRAFGYE